MDPKIELTVSKCPMFEVSGSKNHTLHGILGPESLKIGYLDHEGKVEATPRAALSPAQRPPRLSASSSSLASEEESCMGGCQNDGPLLGPLNTSCRIILRNPEGTTILTTTQYEPWSKLLVHSLVALQSGPVLTMAQNVKEYTVTETTNIQGTTMSLFSHRMHKGSHQDSKLMSTTRVRKSRGLQLPISYFGCI